MFDGSVFSTLNVDYCVFVFLSGRLVKLTDQKTAFAERSQHTTVKLGPNKLLTN
jgi:hypothetical protein